jgi:hypothetical protein
MFPARAPSFRQFVVLCWRSREYGIHWSLPGIGTVVYRRILAPLSSAFGVGKYHS